MFTIDMLVPVKYKEWIYSNYPTPQSVRVKCVEVVKEMVEVFPELKRVRGQVAVEEPLGLLPTNTPHCWCEDPNGTIVDPTSHQFPLRVLDYFPVDESQGNPTGKCPNCGHLCYKGDYLCTEKCTEDYMKYLNGN